MCSYTHMHPTHIHAGIQTRAHTHMHRVHIIPQSGQETAQSSEAPLVFLLLHLPGCCRGEGGTLGCLGGKG